MGPHDLMRGIIIVVLTSAHQDDTPRKQENLELSTRITSTRINLQPSASDLLPASGCLVSAALDCGFLPGAEHGGHISVGCNLFGLIGAREVVLRLLAGHSLQAARQIKILGLQGILD